MRSLSGKTYRPPIPDLQSSHQELLSSSQAKAEALNAFFVQQTDLAGRDSTPDDSPLPSNTEKLDKLCTSMNEVYNV